MATSLTKIGVFYDGNYFLHVSNYYNYVHSRKRRLSIAGLHKFIRDQVAEAENTDVRLCQVVDAHYFRGRLTAQEALQKENQLYYDRVFDDILMNEGVVTHYLPVRNKFGKKEEKGIDVWFALEAYELAILKEYSVVVMIASDGDYVPLIRKINALGARVMLLSWDFEFTDDSGTRKETRTSQDLLEEVSFPIAMHELIDNRLKRNDPVVNNLFTQPSGPKPVVEDHDSSGNSHGAHGSSAVHHHRSEPIDNETHTGYVYSIKNGYGFIYYPPNNLFFHFTDLIQGDFGMLAEGDDVEYNFGKNDKGELVAKNVRTLS